MKLKLLFLTIALFISCFRFYSQISEGFESGLPTSYTSTTTYTLSSGVWTGQDNGIVRTTSGINSGSYSCQLRSQTGAQITSPEITSGIGVLTFWASASTSTNGLQVQYSSDGTNFTQIGATINGLSTSSPSLQTITFNNSSPELYIRFYRTASTIYIDNITTTTYTGTPSITTSTTSLTGFNYVVNSGPSTTQTFTVSGTNLSASISITAPSNYEISTTSGSGFGNSITLSQTSGIVSTTTIYVRLKTGLAIGAYNNENIAVTSTGATTKNNSCSGNVTAAAVSDIITAGGESVTVSALENDSTLTTTADGTQVWQFTIRDGGATVDTDNLPTIVNSITLSQNAGNAIQDWSDAIQAVALFNGTTKITDGLLTPSQITFAATPLISVPDNGTITLTVRLSIQTNPNDSGNNTDGDDFVFNITNANAIADTAGSGFSSFSSLNSTNGQNVLSVVATKLNFTQQPISTGMNSPMTTIKVAAIDANGNIDLGFTGTISLSSTGTMNAVSPVTPAAGVATFTNITHITTGTGLTLTATATGVIPATSATFNINNTTVFKPGELLFVGYDGQESGSGANDEYLIATLVAIVPGTSFTIVNSRYEAGAAANSRTDKWGGGGDDPSEAPYTAIITYNGTTDIPAGSVLAFTTNASTSWFGAVNVITGTTTTTRTSEFSGIANVIYSPNISTSSPDQIYLVQGSFISDGTIDANQANYILAGTLLHGLTNGTAWVPLTTACSGSSVTTNNPRQSRLPNVLTCFNIENTLSGAVSGFYKNDEIHGTSASPALKRSIIQNIGLAENWTLGTGRYTKDPASLTATTAAASYSIGTSNPAGYWIGDSDKNWFNCANWEGLVVPNSSTDISINSNSLEDVEIDNTATYAANYQNLAVCKNLSISDKKLTIDSDANNTLEVYGNLSLLTAGELDMSDDNTATADGQIYLYGNWSNYLESQFKQGNSSIHFIGTTPQTITCASGGPEKFYNVTLANADNPFTTNNFNSDLIAEGNLELSNGCDLTIQSGHYALAAINLIVGTGSELLIESSGSLIQTDATGTVTNSGTINVNRTTSSFEKFDYTYWSSPIATTTISTTFSDWNTQYAFYFDPANFEDAVTINNGVQTATTPDGFDDNGDDWQPATTMSPGKGYAIMGSTSGTFPKTETVTFTGTVNNGTTSTLVNLTPGTSTTDDWNLIGNPYPSAISADAFINANLVGSGTSNETINGTLYFWTHKADIGGGLNLGPSALNFSQDDYAVYTLAGGTGTSASDSGSSIPLGNIASGQAFFVEAEADGNVTFNNSMRSNSYSNAQFYKVAAKSKTASKDRIWLNLENSLGLFSQQLIGYFDNTTLGHDNGYDGLLNNAGNYINFYSFINEDTYKIQGRSAFDENDEVKLGYSSAIAGTFTITIDTKEGVFNDSQTNVFLEDKLLNAIHDLKTTPYVFVTESGTFNNRFVLRYNNKTLGTTDVETVENQVFVSNTNKQIKVSSIVEIIDKVVLYDTSGKQLFQKENVNSNEITIPNLVTNQQTLLVKVSLKNGKSVTKKIVY